MQSSKSVHTPLWKPSRLKRVLAGAAYPIFLALNRPSLAWFGNVDGTA
jgi:hypothetical protein